jgi:hypothetical protein
MFKWQSKAEGQAIVPTKGNLIVTGSRSMSCQCLILYNTIMKMIVNVEIQCVKKKYITKLSYNHAYGFHA